VTTDNNENLEAQLPPIARQLYACLSGLANSSCNSLNTACTCCSSKV